MSHPDEGTIHAWLDGALSGDEATELEAHVAACDVCGAAVAEARGLVAASSRILGALDNVPGGVVPKTGAVSPFVERLRTAPARPVRRWSPRVWAVAATLVMAVGVGVVLQNSDRMPERKESVATAASSPAAPAAVAPQPAVVATGTARAADALGRLDDARAKAVVARPAAPAPGAAAIQSQVAPQLAVGGAGSGAGVAHNAVEPASTLNAAGRAGERAEKRSADGPARAEGMVSAAVATLDAKKAVGELGVADKDSRRQAAATAKFAAPMSVAAAAPASTEASACARFAIGPWRSTSASVAHGVTSVTARPGPTANAVATVTLDYVDGPRTESGAWLLQPDTARLTVRDARDATTLRLLVSRSAGTGTAVLRSAKDSATATAAARLATDGCRAPKPD